MAEAYNWRTRLKEFLAGAGPLKKAAETGDVSSPSASPSQPAGIDVAKVAQEQADQEKARKRAPKATGYDWRVGKRAADGTVTK